MSEMMEIETLDVDPKIKDFVSSIVLRRNLQRQKQWRALIPSNMGIIASYYGNPIEEMEAQGKSLLSTPTLFGLQTIPRYFLDNKSYEAVLVYLTPYGMTAMLNKDAPDTVDKSIALPLSLQEWFPGWDNMDSSFLGLPLNEKAKVIQQSLLDFFNDKSAPEILKNATEIIEQHRGNISIQNLCEQLDITRQGLAYFSKRYMGISLKVYTRIERLNQALDWIVQGKDWDQVIHDCGFFDYSHLTKEIKSFTNMRVAEVKELLSLDRTEITRFFKKQVNCHFFYISNIPSFS